MTEDDTFKALKKWPYEDMIRAWNEEWATYGGETDPWFSDKGWTFEEARDAFIRGGK